jgi:maltose operon protein
MSGDYFILLMWLSLYLRGFFLKKLPFALLACLLTSCSAPNHFVHESFSSLNEQLSNNTALISQLRSNSIKTTSIKQLPFQMLSLNSNNKIEISGQSPVVHFTDGNAFVAALFLPKHINGFSFNLKSNAGKTVFVPSVIFLNNDLAEVSRIDSGQFNKKGFFSIEKTFTDKLAQSIRYILVYSKDSVLNGHTEVINVAREYELEKGNEASEVSFPRLYAKHSPIGSISISFNDVFFSADLVSSRLLGSAAEQNKIIDISTQKSVNTPAILSDTEAFYLVLIKKAMQSGDKIRAKNLMEEAERAGSTKARAYYIETLNEM